MALFKGEIKINYWRVAEWLKATDCKSVLVRVRGFESLPSNNKPMWLSGDSTSLVRKNTNIGGSSPSIGSISRIDVQQCMDYAKYGIMTR